MSNELTMKLKEVYESSKVLKMKFTKEEFVLVMDELLKNKEIIENYFLDYELKLYYFQDYIKKIKLHDLYHVELENKVIKKIERIEKFKQLREAEGVNVDTYYEYFFAYIKTEERLREAIQKVDISSRYSCECYLEQLNNIYLLMEYDNGKKKLSRLVYELQLATTESLIGGSAFTNYNCSFCKETDIWGSTSVPKICQTCAIDLAVKLIKNKTVN